MMPTQIVVLISGYGGNLQAIIDAVEAEKISGQIIAVISDKEEAYGLVRAQEHRIPAYVLTPEKGEPRAVYDERLFTLLQDLNPDLVVLAGFMRILSPRLVDQYAGRMLNIHPALLPKYRGLHTHERAIENGDTLHGVTVHFVTSDLDAGPIIAYSTVPVKPHDTAETLGDRVTYKEHKLYSQVIAWFAAGKLKNEGSRVILNDIVLPKEGVMVD